jgi:hypothetical protein
MKRKTFIGVLVMLVGPLIAPCVVGDARAQAGRSAAGRAGRPPLTPQADLTCGPRCVLAILGYYGKPEEDLIELVREIQWPDLESGSTLASLGEALQRRGIFTKAMTIGANARLRWPHPVVIHIRGERGGGHYVVWVPSASKGEARVWAGLGGWQRGPWEEVARGRSGAILITAPAPIRHPEAAVYDPVQEVLPLGWTAAAALALIVVIKWWFDRRMETEGPSDRPARTGSPARVDPGLSMALEQAENGS